MASSLRLVLLVFAFVLFILAGLNIPPAPPRVQLGWLGLALLTAAVWLH